jgi:type IV pilus assembly protein PilV
MRTPAYSAGFTLIEVMVTVLVLSLGLLGLAAMQINALKNSHQAHLRNQAAALAYEIAERIRSNPPAVTQGDYAIAAAEVPATTADCESYICDAAAMAVYDLNQWKEALAAALPEGDGAIAFGADLVTVSIYWDERRNGASGTDCDADDPADLACLRLSFIP